MKTSPLLALLFALPSLTASAASACDDYSKQLADMVAADQAIREVAPPQFSFRFGTAWEVVDSQNLKRFRMLLKQCGWPVASRYGWEASEAAWLLTQHADSDPSFQKQTLPMLERAVLAGEAKGGHLAYLSDRLAVAEGKPQLYGTQFRTENCKVVLAPIDSREAVNRRRSAIAGMPSLEAYEASARAHFPKDACDPSP